MTYLAVEETTKQSTTGDADYPYRIGDLAKEFDVTLRTLRFYEDKKLLNPKRRGTTRLYSQLDRSHLELILTGKTAGFALTEIRQLMSMYDFDAGEYNDLEAVREMFSEQLHTLAEQRVELDAAEEAVRGAIAGLSK